jgi:hypothetical protein
VTIASIEVCFVNCLIPEVEITSNTHLAWWFEVLQ